MEQTASNEMNNESDGWEPAPNPVSAAQIWETSPELWGPSPEQSDSEGGKTYVDSSAGTVSFDLDEIIDMINKNDFSNIDKKEFSENLFIYKIVFQDESFIEKNFPYTYKTFNFT